MYQNFNLIFNSNLLNIILKKLHKEELELLVHLVWNSFFKKKFLKNLMFFFFVAQGTNRVSFNMNLQATAQGPGKYWIVADNSASYSTDV